MNINYSKFSKILQYLFIALALLSLVFSFVYTENSSSLLSSSIIAVLLFLLLKKDEPLLKN